MYFGTKGQFKMANAPNLHIFGLWEETHVVARGMCKLHTDSYPRSELNPGPWHCEAAVLTTEPPFFRKVFFSVAHQPIPSGLKTNLE